MSNLKMFEPITIGRARCRNRIMRLPTTANLGVNNKASPDLVAHYRSVAAGGCGIIVTEGMAVHPSGLRGPRTIAAFDDEGIKPLRRLTDAVHAKGALVVGQLMHGGRQHHSVRGLPPLVAPSALACDYSGGVPHELSEEEIEDIIAGFAHAAANCIAAGFDGVEIHGAQGYLVQQFLSAASNRRTDAYGGSLINRERFALRIVDAIRDAIGSKPILGFRIGIEEYVEGGLDVEQSEKIIADLARNRFIDYFSLSQGTFPTIETHLPDRHYPAGSRGAAHKRVRAAALGLPVVTCGRYADPEAVERALADEQGDLVGMSRTLTADPDWPNKVRSENIEAIIPCIACNRCWQCSATGEPIKCVVNPRTGQEARPVPHEDVRFASGTRLVVVGSGPAGLAAARVAAEKGARVDLFERDANTGGQLALAATMPHQTELGILAARMREWAEAAGVRIHTDRKATWEMIEKHNAAGVIVATGANLQSKSGRAVASQEITIPSIVSLPQGKGRKALVIDDDGANASVAVAEALVAKGYEVTVTTFHFEPFRELSAVSRLHALAWLDHRDVRIRPNQRYVVDESGEPFLMHKASGKKRPLKKVDIIVRVGDAPADDGIARVLANGPAIVRVVGDARSPRRLEDAIREGEAAARELAFTLAAAETA